MKLVDIIISLVILFSLCLVTYKVKENFSNNNNNSNNKNADVACDGLDWINCMKKDGCSNHSIYASTPIFQEKLKTKGFDDSGNSLYKATGFDERKQTNGQYTGSNMAEICLTQKQFNEFMDSPKENVDPCSIVNENECGDGMWGVYPKYHCSFNNETKKCARTQCKDLNNEDCDGEKGKVNDCQIFENKCMTKDDINKIKNKCKMNHGNPVECEKDDECSVYNLNRINPDFLLGNVTNEFLKNNNLSPNHENKSKFKQSYCYRKSIIDNIMKNKDAKNEMFPCNLHHGNSIECEKDETCSSYNTERINPRFLLGNIKNEVLKNSELSPGHSNKNQFKESYCFTKSKINKIMENDDAKNELFPCTVFHGKEELCNKEVNCEVFNVGKLNTNFLLGNFNDEFLQGIEVSPNYNDETEFKNTYCYSKKHIEEINKRKSSRDKMFSKNYYNEALTGIKGSGYRGKQNVTVSGRTCQKWTEQTPHKHTITPSNYPNYGLGEHNYCRNPNNEETIWCYTNKADKRWEYCQPKYRYNSKGERVDAEIQYEDSELMIDNGINYRGKQNQSVSGQKCQPWNEGINSEKGDECTTLLKKYYNLQSSGISAQEILKLNKDCKNDNKIYTHNFDPKGKYKTSGLDENYCRNPKGEFNTIGCITENGWSDCVPKDVKIDNRTFKVVYSK